MSNTKTTTILAEYKYDFKDACEKGNFSQFDRSVIEAKEVFKDGLTKACEKDHTRIASHILSPDNSFFEWIKSDVNLLNELLEIVCENGNRILAQLIMDANEDVDTERGTYGAAKGGHAEIVRDLIDSYAENYDECLEAACMNGHLDVVEVITETEMANLDDHIGMAVERCYTDIIVYLLDHGASYENALLSAQENDLSEMVDVLEEWAERMGETGGE